MLFFLYLSRIFQSLKSSCIASYRNDLEKLLTILLRFPVFAGNIYRVIKCNVADRYLIIFIKIERHSPGYITIKIFAITRCFKPTRDIT